MAKRTIRTSERKLKKTKKIIVKERLSGDVTNTIYPGGLTVGLEGREKNLKVYGDVSSTGTLRAEELFVAGQPVDGLSSTGVSFTFSTPVLTIDANRGYGDPSDGGDWPSNFDPSANAQITASTSGGTAITTTGHDYTNTSHGGDSNVTLNKYLIDSTNATATTTNGTVLTTEVTGINVSPTTEFSIAFKNGSKTLMVFKATVDSGVQFLTLTELTEHEDAGNSTDFIGATVVFPFKINVSDRVFTTNRTLTVKKLREGATGPQGTPGTDGAEGSDGPAGTAARAVNLAITTGKQVIVYDQDGLNPSPGTGSSAIVITATSVNTSGTAKYRFLLNDSEVQASSTDATYNFGAPASIDHSSLPLKIEVELREGDNSTVLARDQMTIPGVKDGSDAYTVVLENESHTIPADSTGTVIDPDGEGNPLTGYEGSGTKILVYKGGTKLTAISVGNDPVSGEYVVRGQVQSGTITSGSYSVNSDGDAVISNHTNFNSDLALISYTVFAESMSTSVTKLQTIAKSKQGVQGLQGATGATGAAGAAGRTVRLTTTTQAIVYDAAESNPTPDGVSSGQLVTITASGSNIPPGNTPYFTFYKDDVEDRAEGTIATYSYTPRASYSNMPDIIEVEMRESTDSSAPILARDQITIFGLKPGNDGYSVLLGNEAHTIPANFNGTFESGAFTGSGTTLNVFKGTTQLKHTTNSNAGSGFYRYAVSATNITADSSPDTTSSIYEVVYGDASAMSTSSNTASIQFTIYAEEGSADAATITKTQTFSKSKQGQTGTPGASGTDGKTVKLTTAAPQSVEYTAAGARSGSGTIRLTAQAFGTPAEGNSFFYRFTVDGTAGSFSSSTTHVDYTPPASFADMPEIVKVEVGEGTNATNAASNVVAQDEVTMFGIKPGVDGDDAYSMILTNESHSLPATHPTTTTAATYAGSGTTIRVYKGTTELEAVTATPNASQYTVAAVGTNIQPRGSAQPPVGPSSVSANGAVYNDHNGMSQTNATITYTVTTGGGGPTLVKVQTLSKSLKGDEGPTGPNGAASAGVQVRIDPSLAVVQTDSFGAPLTNALDSTEAGIRVAVNGVDQRIDNSGGLSVNNRWRITTDSANAAHAKIILSGSGATGGYGVTQNNNDYQATLSAIDSMTENATYRMIEVQVLVGGTTYKVNAVQQIIKAIAEVSDVQAIIRYPFMSIPLQDYSTYLYPQPLQDNTNHVHPRNEIYFGVDGTGITYDANGASGTNNRWWIDEANIQDTFLDPNYYAAGTPEHGTNLASVSSTPSAASFWPNGGGTYAKIGPTFGVNKLAIGYGRMKPNGSYRRFPIKYRDPAGIIRNYSVTESIFPHRIEPPKGTFKLAIEINFENLPLNLNRTYTPRILQTYLLLRETTVTDENDINSFRHGASNEMGPFPRRVGTTLPTADGTTSVNVQGILQQRWLQLESTTSGNESNRYKRSINITDSRDHAEQALTFNSHTPIRLTGNAFGQAWAAGLAYANSGGEADDVIVGVDLYSIEADSDSHGASRMATYVGSIQFEHKPTSTQAPYMEFSNNLGDNEAWAIHGTRRYDPFDDDTRAYRARSRSSDTEASTEIMKVASGQSIIAVAWFNRQQNTDKFPSAGKIRIDTTIEFYRLIQYSDDELRSIDI